MAVDRVIRVLHHIDLEGQKRAARAVVEKILAARAERLPLWWRWTTGLAAGIIVRRIESA